MAEWSPWQTLDVLRREIDRVFEENGSRRAPASRAAFLLGRAARHYPLINLYEDTEAVYSRPSLQVLTRVACISMSRAIP